MLGKFSVQVKMTATDSVVYYAIVGEPWLVAQKWATNQGYEIRPSRRDFAHSGARRRESAPQP